MIDFLIYFLAGTGTISIITIAAMRIWEKIDQKKIKKQKDEDKRRAHLIIDIADQVEGRMRKVLKEQDRIIGKCKVITKEWKSC